VPCTPISLRAMHHYREGIGYQTVPPTPIKAVPVTIVGSDGASVAASDAEEQPACIPCNCIWSWKQVCVPLFPLALSVSWLLHPECSRRRTPWQVFCCPIGLRQAPFACSLDSGVPMPGRRRMSHWVCGTRTNLEGGREPSIPSINLRYDAKLVPSERRSYTVVLSESSARVVLQCTSRLV
jgi:hypothetical protein